MEVHPASFSSIMLSRIFNFVPSWSLIISSDLKLGSSLNSICLSKIIAGLLFSEIFFELFAIGSEASVPAPALQPGQVLLELGGGRQAIPTV